MRCICLRVAALTSLLFGRVVSRVARPLACLAVCLVASTAGAWEVLGSDDWIPGDAVNFQAGFQVGELSYDAGEYGAARRAYELTYQQCRTASRRRRPFTGRLGRVWSWLHGWSISALVRSLSDCGRQPETCGVLTICSGLPPWTSRQLDQWAYTS